MKTPTRDEMRAHIEKALRAQAPGDYGKPNNRTDEENDAFLVLRGPIGKEVLLYCDSEVASVEFGPASKHFDFAVEEEEEEDDIGGPEGFGENMLGESMGSSDADDDDDDDEVDEDDDEEAGSGSKGFGEEDLRALLKGMVQTTLDIMQEKVFAAEYKKGFARVARFHSAREFEAVKGMKDFRSVSWKGKFDSKGPA